MKIIRTDPVIKTIIKNTEQQPMEIAEDAASLNIKETTSKDMFEFYDKMDQDEAIVSSKSKVFSFEIDKEQIENLQKR